MFNKLTLREWQNINKDNKNLIVQASSIDGSDSWEIFPIGMSWQYSLLNYEKKLQIGKHNKTVLCSINVNTDNIRRNKCSINRKKIVETLKKNDILNYKLNYNIYYNLLPNFKFIISPEGNGIDCHRHYEALIAGCIPIVENNTKIQEKYKDCPILYTNDYSEINEEYLIKKYDEMIDKEYDFSKLFIDYYTDEQQKHIKINGNYWILKNTNKNWYD